VHTSDAKQLAYFNAINVYEAKPESEKVRRTLIRFPEGITADTALVGQQPGSNKNKLETFKKIHFYPINLGSKTRFNMGKHVYWKIGISKSKFFFHKPNKAQEDADCLNALKPLDDLNCKMEEVNMTGVCSNV
jgi:hypothetical protein